MFLKQATWDIHLRLEKRLAVKDRFSDVGLYCKHLGRLWAFQATAEENWSVPLGQALDDYSVRRKADLIAGDIVALGFAPPTAHAEIPETAGPVEALGGFYVFEGATLGGQHLLPIVERKLGLSADRGASYLASYGAQVKPMWQKFLATVDAHCATPQAREQAAAKARETFLALERWLCADLA
jgi:heme oxygenase